MLKQILNVRTLKTELSKFQKKLSIFFKHMAYQKSVYFSEKYS